MVKLVEIVVPFLDPLEILSVSTGLLGRGEG